MTPDDPRPTLPYHRHDTPPGSEGTFPPDAGSFLGRVGLGPDDTASSDTAFEVAHRLAPPEIPGFELLGELGVGGMGVVYMAREVGLKRVVALKMIRPDTRPGARDVARFQAEAEAVAAVRHPNVVEVYSTGRAGGLPYFVMEYVAGGTLAKRLAAGPLAPAEAAAVVAAVARGVHAAHAAGIVHRDLKPGNVLLASSEDKPGSTPSLLTADCPPPTPKVSDFGLAKRLSTAGDGLTKTVAVIGTPAYMAPEQARGNGKFVGPEADVYALGVVLYECLVGRPPFTDEELLVLMRRVADETPAPPRSVVAAVPRDLDLICRKCLAKEPGDRYATAAELADDLDRFLAGRPVAARPIPWPVRAARWVRRNPAAAALAALVVLLLALGPALAVWYRGERQVSAANEVAREEALKRAEEQAHREAERREAAEALAGARELVALQGVIRRREADRTTGWTWANRADLRKGAALAGGDPTALTALRSDAVTALLAADLRPAGAVLPGFTAGAAAASPDGRLVALGQFHAWGPGDTWGALGALTDAVAPMHVVVVDPATGATAYDFAFPARAVPREAGLAPDRVTSLAFAPDGKRLFAGTRSNRVVRLDLGGPGGKAARVWKAPDTPGHLAVSADGAEVLGACGRTLVWWDAETGAERGRADGGARLTGLAVEPGAVVVARDTGLARAAAAAKVLPRPADPALPGAALPAVLPGGLMVVAREGAIELLDAADLRPVARLTDPGLLDQAAHAAGIEAVAVHPSGAYLATASANRVVKVWAVASGQRVAMAPVPGTGPAALAWSGDGRFLLVTGPGQTTRFEFAPPAAERVVGVHPYPLALAIPDRDGGVVALGEVSRVPAPGQLLFRAGLDGRTSASLRLPGATTAPRPGLAVHPKTGAVAVAGMTPGVSLWTPARPGALAPLDPALAGAARCPAFTPEGREAWAVIESDVVRAWDAETGQSLGPGWRNDAGLVVTGQSSLEALAVGRGGGVAGGADGAVHLLDAAAARRVEILPGERDPVLAVALAPAEDVAAAGTQGGKLRLVRLADRTELPVTADAHPGGVTAVSFSADGAVLATGGRDRAVRFWKRADDRYEPAAAVTGLPAPVRSLAFAPDGRGLVVLLAGERAARVWDAARLRVQLRELGLDW